MGIFLVQSVTGVEPASPGFGRNFNTADRPPNRLSYAPTGYIQILKRPRQHQVVPFSEFDGLYHGLWPLFDAEKYFQE